jgi:hypothetical protein
VHWAEKNGRTQTGKAAVAPQVKGRYSYLP